MPTDPDGLTTWFKPEDKGTGIRSVSGTATPNGKVLDRDSYPRRVQLYNGWCRTWREARQSQQAKAVKRVCAAEAALEAARAHLSEVEALMESEEAESRVD